jgi:hypothetical protein
LAESPEHLHQVSLARHEAQTIKFCILHHFVEEVSGIAGVKDIIE